MFDPLLSREEIQALLGTAGSKGSAEDVRDVQVTATINEHGVSLNTEQYLLGNKEMTETRKVVFPQIKQNQIKRKDAKMVELSHVTFDVEIVLGEAFFTLGQLLNLKKDAVIVLDRLTGGNAELFVNGTPLVEGEIIVSNDCFALRVNVLDEGKKATGVRNQEEEKEEA